MKGQKMSDIRRQISWGVTEGIIALFAKTRFLNWQKYKWRQKLVNDKFFEKNPLHRMEVASL